VGRLHGSWISKRRVPPTRANGIDAVRRGVDGACRALHRSLRGVWGATETPSGSSLAWPPRLVEECVAMTALEQVLTSRAVSHAAKLWARGLGCRRQELSRNLVVRWSTGRDSFHIAPAVAPAPCAPPSDPVNA